MLAGTWQLHDFAKRFSWRAGRHNQTGLLNPRQIMVVGLIAVPMALGHFGAINFGRQRAGFHRAGLRTEPHGAAQIRVHIASFDLAVMILPFSD